MVGIHSSQRLYLVQSSMVHGFSINERESGWWITTRSVWWRSH